MTELKNKLIELADSTRNEIKSYVGDTRDFLAVRLSTLQEIINLLGNKEPEASEPVFPESALQKMKAGLEKWDKLSKEFDEILNDENIKKLFGVSGEQK